MKATGIVRRVDDLGRIVIPKEIRRSLHIKEGELLELYLSEGGMLLKKYSPYGEFDYLKAFQMAKIITNLGFALYDYDGNCRKRTSAYFPTNMADTTDECHFIPVIDTAGDHICTVGVDPDMSDIERNQIAEIIKILAQQD